MRMISSLMLLCLAMPQLALAQDRLVVDLPSGQVSIAMDKDFAAIAQSATVAKTVLIDTAYAPKLMATHKNSILLEVYSGGTACPVDYVWLTLSESELKLSDYTNSCLEGAQVIETDGYPRLVIDGFNDASNRYSYDFDGTALSISKIEAEAPAVGTEPASFWLGKSASDLMDDARMLPALQEILSEDQITDLRKAVVLQLTGDTFRTEGDWLIGGGCEPASTGAFCAQIGVSKEGDKLLVGLEYEGVVEPIGKGAGDLFGTRAFTPEQILGSWTIASVNGQALPVSGESLPVLTFDADGTLSGHLPCNRLVGRAQIEKRVAVFSELSTSRKSCPELVTEAEILEILGQSQRWVGTEAGLELRDAQGKAILLQRGG